jgi:hypothetical protein
MSSPTDDFESRDGSLESTQESRQEISGPTRQESGPSDDTTSTGNRVTGSRMREQQRPQLQQVRRRFFRHPAEDVKSHAFLKVNLTPNLSDV